MRISDVIGPVNESLFEDLGRKNTTGYLLNDLKQIVNEYQFGHWQEGVGADKPFMRGDLYNATYAVKVQPYPAIRKKFRDFMELKRSNPTAPFGGSDKTFNSDGFFSAAVPGLRHAHITFDLSIVYKVVGNQIYLYGFFTHDDLGTGQPRNINRQKNAAKRLSQQNFNEQNG